MASSDLGLNKNTIVEHYKFLRKMCLESLVNNSEMIEVINKIVEIDETMLYCRKNNKGRLTKPQRKQVWVFGGVERESRKVFAEIVPNRAADTLLNVIKKKNRPGTFVKSEGWREYTKLNESDYAHGWVNHSKNFLKPSDKLIHTQTIERRWRSLKEAIPKNLNVDDKIYNIEYLYRCKYHRLGENGFSIFIKQ
ncbi:uncharacterized protein LOC128397034 [Panonychus citri]|uniref:uncharacterized protein LOC128397034 n=1 Tax=Panonychus citri TaxID=50023 RepID=UPI00230705F7|nr:uncharacterized protein LOC128397034 [Panonychus citri]